MVPVSPLMLVFALSKIGKDTMELLLVMTLSGLSPSGFALHALIL
jgi:hypothetical protein